MEGRLADAAVVVVEDDAALRAVVERALAAESCRVLAFAGGPEALAAIGRAAPDLLLTDLGLPGMDGLALIEQARALDPALAVLVMTGWETANSAIAAADLGVDGYLRKPFTLQRLAASARRALGRRQMEQRLRALEAERAADAARSEALRVIGRSLPHELHQPLSCIMGYAALLEEGDVSAEEMQTYAQEIVAASERLADLVRKLETAHTYATKDLGAGNVVLDVQKTSS